MAFKEGDIAVNESTGDSLVYRNNQWIPYTEEEESFLQEAGDFLEENLDLPGGLAGAIAGAKVGAVGGLPGMITGGIVGGAAGTFGGSLASSALEGEADFEKAAKEAGTSVAIDVATLGAGKVLRPIAKSLGITPTDLISKFRKKAPEVTAPTQAPVAVPSGTPESLKATQDLLEKEGGTLLASQTQNASKLRRVGETISQVGLFSKARLESIAQSNKQSIVSEIDKMIAGIDPNLATTAGNMGQHIHEIISSGRKLNMINYSQGLTRIADKFGDAKVSPQPILNTIEDFLASSTKDGLSTLKPETVQIIEKAKRDLVGQQLAVKYAKGDTAAKLPQATLNKIFAFQKSLNDDISSFGSFGSPTFNSQVEKELSDLSSNLRKSVTKSLSSVNEQVAKDYSAINKVYGETLDGLLPTVNKTIVAGADKGDYDRIGNLLLSNNNVSKIESMMKSIDTAFAQTKKTGLPVQSSIQTANQAKQMIRQSYIKNMFGETVGDFDPYKWANKAKSFDKNPSEVAKLKAVLGNEAYASFKTLTNAIADSSSKPTADAFSLMLRGRESAATIGLLGTAGAAGFASGLLPAFAVFAIPDVIGRVATNKKATRRLLMLNEQVKKNPNLKVELATSQIAKIFNELEESDREAIADSVNGVY